MRNLSQAYLSHITQNYIVYGLVTYRSSGLLTMFLAGILATQLTFYITLALWQHDKLCKSFDNTVWT